MRLTGSVAMDRRHEHFEEAMKDNGITRYLSKKYVDDVNLLVEDPEPESAWCKGCHREIE